jgi:hypothetical protein
MVISHVRGVIVFVADDTTKGCKIVGSGMAFGAQRPGVFMFPAINWEILLVVVKGRRSPGGRGMAVLASRWETCGSVVRIGSRVIIGGMATVTGGWGIVIITIVASCTIVGNGGMRTSECPETIVNGESGRFPVRRRGMAHRAIGGQI